jgi:hypothetical protein
MSLSLLTLLKYLAAIKNIYLSQRQITLSICSIWLFFGLLLVVFIPLADDIQNALQPSHIYCFIANYSTDTYVMASSLVALLYILCNMIFQVWAYSVIVYTYSSLQSRKRKKGNHTANEVRLMKKAICICAAFITCWMFFVAKIVYELITKSPSPIEYDSIVVSAAAMHPIINGIVLYTYDAKVRLNIQDLIPFLKPKKKIIKKIINTRAVNGEAARELEREENRVVVQQSAPLETQILSDMPTQIINLNPKPNVNI